MNFTVVNPRKLSQLITMACSRLLKHENDVMHSHATVQIAHKSSDNERPLRLHGSINQGQILSTSNSNKFSLLKCRCSIFSRSFMRWDHHLMFLITKGLRLISPAWRQWFRLRDVMNYPPFLGENRGAFLGDCRFCSLRNFLWRCAFDYFAGRTFAEI